VSEGRARQLEGHESDSGRVLTATNPAEYQTRTVETSARAVRVDEREAMATKGGGTGDERHGRPQPEQGQPAQAEVPEPDATPGAREAAEEMGISLSAVEGTGANGRVTKADVWAYSEAHTGRE